MYTILKYIQPSFPSKLRKFYVTPPLEVDKERAKKRERYVINFFIGKKLPFLLVKRYAKWSWSKFGLVDLISTRAGMYLLKFKEYEGMMKVLEHLG